MRMFRLRRLRVREGLVALVLMRYRAGMSAHSTLSVNQPWRAEFGATLALAWPLILTNLTQILLNTTDVLLLGRVGADALGASALGSGIVIAFFVFGMGLVTASSPMIASELGRRSNSVRDVRRTVRQTMWSAVAITVPMWLILWNVEPLLHWAGQPEPLATDTGLFIRALQWEILPGLLTLSLRNFIAALEKPIWILMVSVGGVIVNALLNWALIFGHFGLPALGLVGAGIGTSITSTLMFFAMLIVVTQQKQFRRFRLLGNFWRADWPRLRAIWTLGFPIALTLGFEAAVFAAAVFLMGYINTASVAAHAIAIQIASITFMVPLGIAQAATVRVGSALGRGDEAAIRRAGWAAYTIGVGFMAAMALLLWTMPRTLAALFMDPAMPGNAEVLDIAVGFLGVAALFQIVDGAQSVNAGMLRGLHDTKVPMLFAAFGYWVIGIGVGGFLAFVAKWDGLGIWIGLASGLAIVAVLMLLRWRQLLRAGFTDVSSQIPRAIPTP